MMMMMMMIKNVNEKKIELIKILESNFFKFFIRNPDIGAKMKLERKKHCNEEF